jgi:hypothetical protein
MLDLNLKRRNREREIAREIAAELTQHCTSTTAAPPPLEVAHHFATVFARLGITPTDAEARRISEYVRTDIAKRARTAGDLAANVASHRLDAERWLADLSRTPG